MTAIDAISTSDDLSRDVGEKLATRRYALIEAGRYVI